MGISIDALKRIRVNATPLVVIQAPDYGTRGQAPDYGIRGQAPDYGTRGQVPIRIQEFLYALI